MEIPLSPIKATVNISLLSDDSCSSFAMVVHETEYAGSHLLEVRRNPG
jgi:hypothetical protein